MTLGGARLRQELAALGLDEGSTVLVHCSMRAVGPVPGGAQALLEALLDVLGPDGTLVVPTQTPSKSMTSREFRRALNDLSDADRERLLASHPGFDPATTPSEGMGVLAELVRTHPRARRSGHPTTSFAAIGRRAAELTAEHPYDCLLGADSPLGRIRAGAPDARVLLLGVGYDKCTAFHLGEDATVCPVRSYRFKVGDDWCEVSGARDYDDSDFADLGSQFETIHKDEVLFGLVGAAHCRLFPLSRAADFAAWWLPETRQRAAGYAPEI